MSKKLEILKNSLEKKNKKLNEKFAIHFADVKSTNGQPLNDKRNGRATFNRWEKQNESIRKLKGSIEMTEEAIEKEEDRIENCKNTNEVLPSQILKLVEQGILTQWRRFPHYFFVKDVNKARIKWVEKKGIILAYYVNDIEDQEQYTKFRDVFNELKNDINGSF